MSSSNPLESFRPLLESGAAASAAIVFPFRDLVAKSYQQRGQSVPKMTLLEGLKGGFKAAPTVGVIVGGQMWFSQWLDTQWKQRGYVTDTKKFSVITTLGTPAVVGFVSAPFLAVFNGFSNGLTAKQSLAQLRGAFGLKVCLAIALQETAFVAGLKAGEQMSKIGDNSFVGYAAAFTAGAVGSLAGHPFNTALTRWQQKQNVSPKQLFWGSLRKARAIGLFALIYKCEKEVLNMFKVKDNHG